ncbi:MAG: rubrerythrin family protein [Candidatus Gastranaerophilales bacterium]|nr:rubrerythrin family protein [Candidatus Gastranaerophilales bacterium]
MDEKSIIKGTQTEINLMKAFAGESMARNRYNISATVARNEGYQQIAGFFDMTADNEKEHAKIYYKYMAPGIIEIKASYPQCYSDTYQNLICAAEGEYDEWKDLYPSYADTADEEGFGEIAHSFRNIAHVEEHHHNRYVKLAENLKDGVIFTRNDEEYWVCRKCGYVALGKNAPQVCPACKHPQAYYELLCENF